ncbi:hypothetical protein TWF506_004872 [Arthrobotrys conoides]|uniref:Uncharacterized protein n=1 Tax=Arthrobotrys conoides TaxID=74498 RepID=A0AAN8RVM5_9PEZI
MPFQETSILYRPLKYRVPPPPPEPPVQLKWLGIPQSEIDAKISSLEACLESDEERYKKQHQNIKAAIQDLKNGIASEYYQQGKPCRMYDLTLHYKFLKKNPVWSEAEFYVPESVKRNKRAREDAKRRAAAEAKSRETEPSFVDSFCD